MKLVILIPCYNEEKTLPLVLKELPKKITGIDEIVILVVNDGSIDKTKEVAESYGCKVVSLKKNRGLAMAFKRGVFEAIKLNADILVNTDGDNQYPSRYIPSLVQPILDKKADLVIGDRETQKISHFSVIKKSFQFFGSLTVSFLSGTKINDTVSGFRAYSKEALLSLNITSNFSYVLDTIIQASKKGLKIVEIKIKTNKPTRKSRLFTNIFDHIKKSSIDLIRVYVMYDPLKVFIYLSSIFFIPGILLLVRFFYYYLSGVNGYVQSLIISGILLGFSFFLVGMGIIGDINNKNRSLIEDVLYNQKSTEYKKIKNENINN